MVNATPSVSSRQPLVLEGTADLSDTSDTGWGVRKAALKQSTTYSQPLHRGS